MNVTTPVFTRDRLTWLSYWMLGLYAYLQAILGPLMPFLRAELNLNYTIAAMHLSAFAIGMITAGLTGERVAALVGRKRLLWGGGFSLSAGAILLIAGQSPVITIAAAFIMGWLGSYLLVMIQAVLSDHHGENRAIPLTESNAFAVIFTTCAPLLISAGASSGIGWRAALVIGAIAYVVMFVVYRNEPISDAPRAAVSPAAHTAPLSKPLPMRFWVIFVLIIFVVSVEWSLGFWGADFLNNIVGLERATASGLMTAYFFGMVIGRFVGSRFTRTMPPTRLLFFAAALVIIGFPFFWLGEVAIVNIVGLFVTGLGVANLFPLSISLATGVDPEQANKASARVALGAGAAMLLAPQVMGAFADQVGIQNAFAVTAAMIAGSVFFIVLANRNRTKSASLSRSAAD